MGMNGLPFEAGQEVECRSFIPGYRGAWFRCKVTITVNSTGKYPLVINFVLLQACFELEDFTSYNYDY